MANGADYDQPARYQVRVKGLLDQERAAWFEGLKIVPLDREETLLAGQVDDQAALHGLLSKIHNLGLTLISVLRETEETT